MAVVGMLHHRNHPGKVKKAYAFAAVAKMEGIEFIYFSYRDVNLTQKQIKGWIYENGSWEQKVIDFPPVVINSSSPKNKRQTNILRELKKEVKFTSYPVGNKMQVYKKILNGKKFAHYFIPSFSLKDMNDMDEQFSSHSKLVLKPYSGNHGKNVYFIEKAAGFYQITDGQRKSALMREEFADWLHTKTVDQKYMIQPFIECKTKAGLTYDIRIHVQKNGQGKWEINLMYPRVSSTKLVSNISNGGYRGELGPFLREEFGDSHDHVRNMLESFALSFSPHFDSLYPYSFDELGIDAGIDQQLTLWVFEVNWRPGSAHREFEVAKRLIPYCKYLQNG